MGYKNYTGGARSIQSHRPGVDRGCGRRRNSLENNKKHIVRTILFALLPLNAFAAADRFPGVQDELNGLVNAAVTVASPAAAGSLSVDTPVGSGVPVMDPAERAVPESTASPDVNPGDESLNGYANQEPASLGVVDTGVTERIQGSSPVVAVVRNTTALEVVDTGTAKQVENPLPSTVTSLKTVSLEVTDTGTSRQVQVSQSATREASAAAEAETNIAPEWTDAKNPVSGNFSEENQRLALAETGVAAGNEMAGAVAVAWNGNGRPEDNPGSLASSENIELPYAVLLAILALMSMIPISRRN